MGWNKGFSARRCDTTEELGVNQLSGGVALSKRADASNGFSRQRISSLLSINRIELFLCYLLRCVRTGLCIFELCLLLQERTSVGFWVQSDQASYSPAGKANSRHTPDPPLFSATGISFMDEAMAHNMCKVSKISFVRLAAY